MLLVRNAHLLTVIERSDIPSCAPNAAPANALGRLGDRVITGTEPLPRAIQQMRATGQRRLAVVGVSYRLCK